MSLKKTLGTIGKTVASVVTGGASDRVLDIIEGAVSPEAKVEVQKAREDRKLEIAKVNSEERTRTAEAAAEIIVAEAKSDSAMARTARPGTIWCLTILIVANYGIPLLVNMALKVGAIFFYTQDPETGALIMPEVPKIEPEVLPAILFGVWGTSLGGYIWSRRAEKKDRILAEEGALK